VYAVWRAACWERKGAMAEMLLLTVWRSCDTSVVLRARRRASFSGFGGIGGAGRGAWVPVWDGRVTSRGSSKRFVGALGAAF
jgi:hypothetical protein